MTEMIKIFKQLVDGIFVEMKDLGIWSGEVIDPKEPLISTDGQVHYLNAGYAGVFLPTVKHWTNVKAGIRYEESKVISVKFSLSRSI